MIILKSSVSDLKFRCKSVYMAKNIAVSVSREHVVPFDDSVSARFLLGPTTGVSPPCAMLLCLHNPPMNFTEGYGPTRCLFMVAFVRYIDYGALQ
jgi:hypothetical protein